MRVVWLVLFLGLFQSNALLAQWTDSFDDGEFSTGPSWSGEVSEWTVVPFGDNFALRTNGATRSDTLTLSTQSQISFGSWNLTFRYELGRLSNFNMARVYLLSDSTVPGDSTYGYYIQFGTNSRDIRLYRSDPDASGGRTLLGQTEADFLLEEERTLSAVITRNPDNNWVVIIDGMVVLDVIEKGTIISSSSHFGLWVKHSSLRGNGYFFDDFDVSGTTRPPDIEPPTVNSLVYDSNLPGITLRFSETLDPGTITPDAFSVSNGIGHPSAVAPSVGDFEGTALDLLLDNRLLNGEYALDISGLADLNGNMMSDTTLAFTVSVDSSPPTLISAIAFDANQVGVVFSEPVLGCDPSLYDISDGIGNPSAVIDCPQVGADSVRLELSTALISGHYYTLTVQNVSDLNGNVLAKASADFSYISTTDLPRRGDIVINEIFYAPPESDMEFVEVFNKTAKVFDFNTLSISDNRFDPVPISTSTYLLSPGGYGVLVRDSSAFAEHYPGVQFVPVKDWPALNNSGDTVALFSSSGIVDSVSYRTSWGGSGVSLERLDPNGPSNSNTNWGSSRAQFGATPGLRNSIFAPDVSPPEPVFADQIDTRVVKVLFDEPIEPSSVFNENISLDGKTPFQIAFGSAGTTLALSFQREIAPVTLRLQGMRDLTGNELSSTTISVARLALPGNLVINEIMYDPLADAFDGRDDQPEYVELLNVTSLPVSLRGFFWTNLADERGDADTTSFVVTPVAILPGNYAVVFAQPSKQDPNTIATTSSLALAFPFDYDDEGVLLLQVQASTLGLLNGGDLVRMHREDGLMIDQISYMPSWHNQALATTRGISLERIDAEGPSNLATNWASSQFQNGGTPGFLNSVSSAQIARGPRPGDLFINEIMYEPRFDANDGLPDQPEYFEIINLAAVPIELNGMFVTGRPDEHNDADTVRISFSPTVLPPSGYAVVFNVSDRIPDDSLSSMLSSSFPAVDPASPELVLLPTRASLALSNDGDQIRLHDADGTTIEDVTYDPSWHSPNLRETRGTSLERIDPGLPANDATNWTSSVANKGGTPGTENSVFLRPVTLRQSPGLTVSPSPFSPDGDGFEDVTGIRYTLIQSTELIRARIFDSRGRLVRTLTQGQLSGKAGTLIWDGLDDHRRRLRIGIYVVILESVASKLGTSESYKKPVVLARPLN